MPRRREVPKREILPDPKFGDLLVAKFVNMLMKHGKKSTAEKILYQSFDSVKNKNGQDGLEVFKIHLRPISRNCRRFPKSP